MQFGDSIDSAYWGSYGGAPKLFNQSSSDDRPTTGCATLDAHEAIRAEYSSINDWFSKSTSEDLLLIAFASGFADTETAQRSLELLDKSSVDCAGVTVGGTDDSTQTFVAGPLDLPELSIASVGQATVFNDDSEWVYWSANLGLRNATLTVMLRVSVPATPTEIAAFESAVVAGASALLAQDEIAQVSAAPPAAAEPEPAPPGTGHAPTVSQWSILNELVDLSDAPQLSRADVDEQLEKAFGDRITRADFTEEEQECLAVEFAVLERNGNLNSVISPISARWCAPAFFADRWALTEPHEYNASSTNAVRIEDAGKRECFIHVIVSVACSSSNKKRLVATPSIRIPRMCCCSLNSIMTPRWRLSASSIG